MEGEVNQNQLIKVNWKALENSQDQIAVEDQANLVTRLKEALTDENKYSLEHQQLLSNQILGAISELKRVLSIEKRLILK